jgi:hypothetical protein
MFGLFSPYGATGGNGDKAYQCSGCSALIASSDCLLAVGGARHHHFTNPAGIECDFCTFASCHGVVATGVATEENTWFPGYRWRFAFCRRCRRHLGWRYEAISMDVRPIQFWGILLAHVFIR